jgi:predicted HTH domain antitoxin
MSEGTVTLQDAIEITAELSPTDQLRLIAALTDRLGRELSWSSISSQQEILSTEALDRAITLYRQDAVTLARAAEIAGITRWELMGVLETHGTPVTVEVPPVEEMDRDLAAYLE